MMIKFVWIIGAMVVLAIGAKAEEPVIQPSDTTQLILLGTGNPNPTPETAGPATVIIVNDTPYIFDAGEGVMRRAEAARQKYNLKGLERIKFAHLFLTHLHWDHTVGIPEVMMTPWTQGREAPLFMYGPTGTAHMAKSFLEAFRQDIAIRVKGLEPATRHGWQVEAIEFEGSYTYRDKNVTIEAFPVCHGDIKNAVGYKVTTPDRVIVLSGDTAYCPIIAEKARGADILVHEGYPTKSHAKLPADWAAYHTAFHTAGIDIARIANAAKPKLLVISHQLTWKGDPHSMITDEIAETYDSKVVNGKDLDLF